MRRLSGLVLLALVGCDADGDGLSASKEKDLGLDPTLEDSDSDGVTDGQEVELGLDPKSPDSDDDGLLDGEEADHGTDPLDKDTDGDGYRDGDEVTEAKDPLDPFSVIYTGGWPYNANKDEIADPGLSGKAKKDEIFANFSLTDQHGEKVSLYDFAHGDRKVLIDLSAEWCGPCNSYAAWMAGLPGYESFDASYPGLRDAVNNGEIYYLSILSQVNSGAKATDKLVERWDRKYPNENVPVLADKTWAVDNYISGVYYPSFILLDEDMVVEIWNKNNPETALLVAAQQVSE